MMMMMHTRLNVRYSEEVIVECSRQWYYSAETLIIDISSYIRRRDTISTANRYAIAGKSVWKHQLQGTTRK